MSVRKLHICFNKGGYAAFLCVGKRILPSIFNVLPPFIKRRIAALPFVLRFSYLFTIFGVEHQLAKIAGGFFVPKQVWASFCIPVLLVGLGTGITQAAPATANAWFIFSSNWLHLLSIGKKIKFVVHL
ncbi:hypothetical protein SP90_03735 [Halodesulfovibrio spirochaetisodalis]|uniref:Uncharacterized protein n=1 Tax=Halodesulfovibrio spirochaetisodalis TaxID=1560234 RepID=A0A1B7XJP6_9BACT|nr:hypothetical protein SP90_03735 [Halodesulfovibrio spirochaetisodalis]